MSRSNPTQNNPNPCTRWLEWSGARGELSHYDKAAKKNVLVPDGFTFIPLDELSVVKGWHDASDSGITSNEVRDTKAETLCVKAFKGGILAEGYYAAIRDRIVAKGGKFITSIYLAFKSGDGLALGNLHLSGAALSSWFEFRKEHRAEIYTAAVQIKGYTEAKNGAVTYRTPKFKIASVTPETDAQAKGLDVELQEFLAGYFKRTRTEQVEQPHHDDDDPPLREPHIDHSPTTPEPDGDNVPF